MKASILTEEFVVDDGGTASMSQTNLNIIFNLVS